MESVGAVSDFENEWSSDESTTASSNNVREFRPYSNRREGLPWIVYAAAAVITLSFGAWWLLDRSEPQQAVFGSVSGQTEGPKVDLVKPVDTHSIAESKKVVATSSGNPKPIIASQPIPEKPMQIADTPLVKPTEPSTSPSLSDKPSTTQPQPTETQKQAEKEPVIIRKAILPTAEEIERMKQGLVKRHLGSLPITNTASELPRPPL